MKFSKYIAIIYLIVRKIDMTGKSSEFRVSSFELGKRPNIPLYLSLSIQSVVRFFCSGKLTYEQIVYTILL